ncbi:type II toxin-antitoxin system HicB family antitoxin [Ruminococcus flavefaciens]|uniref:type II toxin-antitoxin system HicB family antitoxin n=2 Tax=Ruminococcus flavefaciens TaxID=1265 RepID=UPI0026EAE8C3|nr:type II toxin-antitoxin system HicB family antitoxin [Ruminococcus flavefaciens]
MAKYVYPAIFSPSDDGGFTVSFPDVSGCYTEGDTLAEAMEQAKDALCLILYDLEEREESIPVPTSINDVVTENGDIVSLVACDTLEYRKFFDKKAVKKTLTIPNWLNTMAERADINFSAALQEALIEKLHIN